MAQISATLLSTTAVGSNIAGILQGTTEVIVNSGVAPFTTNTVPFPYSPSSSYSLLSGRNGQQSTADQVLITNQMKQHYYMTAQSYLQINRSYTWSGQFTQTIRVNIIPPPTPASNPIRDKSLYRTKAVFTLDSPMVSSLLPTSLATMIRLETPSHLNKGTAVQLDRQYTGTLFTLLWSTDENIIGLQLAYDSFNAPGVFVVTSSIPPFAVFPQLIQQINLLQALPLSTVINVPLFYAPDEQNVFNINVALTQELIPPVPPVPPTPTPTPIVDDEGGLWDEKQKLYDLTKQRDLRMAQDLPDLTLIKDILDAGISESIPKMTEILTATGNPTAQGLSDTFNTLKDAYSLYDRFFFDKSGPLTLKESLLQTEIDSQRQVLANAGVTNELLQVTNSRAHKILSTNLAQQRMNELKSMDPESLEFRNKKDMFFRNAMLELLSDDQSQYQEVLKQMPQSLNTEPLSEQQYAYDKLVLFQKKWKNQHNFWYYWYAYAPSHRDVTNFIYNLSRDTLGVIDPLLLAVLTLDRYTDSFSMFQARITEIVAQQAQRILFGKLSNFIFRREVSQAMEAGNGVIQAYVQANDVVPNVPIVNEQLVSNLAGNLVQVQEVVNFVQEAFSHPELLQQLPEQVFDSLNDSFRSVSSRFSQNGEVFTESNQFLKKGDRFLKQASNIVSKKQDGDLTKQIKFNLGVKNLPNYEHQQDTLKRLQDKAARTEQFAMSELADDLRFRKNARLLPQYNSKLDHRTDRKRQSKEERKGYYKEQKQQRKQFWKYHPQQAEGLEQLYDKIKTKDQTLFQQWKIAKVLLGVAIPGLILSQLPVFEQNKHTQIYNSQMMFNRASNQSEGSQVVVEQRKESQGEKKSQSQGNEVPQKQPGKDKGDGNDDEEEKKPKDKNNQDDKPDIILSIIQEFINELEKSDDDEILWFMKTYYGIRQQNTSPALLPYILIAGSYGINKFNLNPESLKKVTDKFQKTLQARGITLPDGLKHGMEQLDPKTDLNSVANLMEVVSTSILPSYAIKAAKQGVNMLVRAGVAALGVPSIVSNPILDTVLKKADDLIDKLSNRATSKLKELFQKPKVDRLKNAERLRFNAKQPTQVKKEVSKSIDQSRKSHKDMAANAEKLRSNSKKMQPKAQEPEIEKSKREPIPNRALNAERLRSNSKRVQPKVEIANAEPLKINQPIAHPKPNVQKKEVSVVPMQQSVSQRPQSYSIKPNKKVKTINLIPPSTFRLGKPLKTKAIKKAFRLSPNTKFIVAPEVGVVQRQQNLLQRTQAYSIKPKKKVKTINLIPPSTFRLGKPLKTKAIKKAFRLSPDTKFIVTPKTLPKSKLPAPSELVTINLKTMAPSIAALIYALARNPDNGANQFTSEANPGFPGGQQPSSKTSMIPGGGGNKRGRKKKEGEQICFDREGVIVPCRKRFKK